MSIPSHVLLTTPMLTILFRRERDGRPAKARSASRERRQPRKQEDRVLPD